MKTNATIHDEDGRYNNIKAKVALKEAYDITYALYDHDAPELQHPLQYHLMTEKKMFKKFGLFREYLRRYHVHQIKKYFGLSFLEFIELPIDKVDDMFEMSNVLSAEETKIMDNLTNNQNREVARMESQMNQPMLQFDGF